MSIIVSIHQPNNHLFNCFDSVYVLAKGGVCLYSGLPQDLRQHLNDCQIECNENQVPIEELIKISYNGVSDEKVQKLSEKSKENSEKTKISSDYLNITKLKSNRNSKAFKTIDIWYLLSRFLYRNYVSQWKSTLKSILFFTFLIIFFVLCFNPKVSEISGCFEVNTPSNLSCIEKEEEKSILYQNQTMIFVTSYLILTVLSVFTVNSYIMDLNLLKSERQNCKFNHHENVYQT